MADGQCQRIRSIGLRQFGEIEQLLDHVLDLRLAGGPVANHGLLHPAWGIFIHGQSQSAAGLNSHATGLTQHQSCPGILEEKSPFDGDGLGLVFFDDLEQSGPESTKTFADGCRGWNANGCLADGDEAIALLLDHTHTRGPERGVDTQDPGDWTRRRHGLILLKSAAQRRGYKGKCPESGLCGQRLKNFVRGIHVRIDVLNIIIVFQVLDKAHDGRRDTLVGHGYRGGG